ncbi:Lipopolysaccharide export system ATP-binding protein LptB [subsurface metagenome]
MEALRAEGLSKDFGGVHALRNVSFSVEAGERLAIIGPNGAGKTTLFNLLSGQLSPTAGRVYLFGQEITNIAAHNRAHLGIARSFQLTTLFPNLTVLDNILLALQGTRPSRFQMFRSATAYEHLYTKAQKLLDSMDLWEKKDNPARAISYGEQRKLEIALSLASEPKLLLLDEPSAGLAAAEATTFTNTVRNLLGDTTLIFCAHDMDLVFNLADRITVLHFGQIIAQGTPQEIQANPRVKEIYLGSEEST